MRSPVAIFVEDIDGVHGGIADAVAERFETVAALSEADAHTLTSIRGIGPVVAERLLAAARTAVIANHTPEEEPDPTPDTRARARVAQARAASRPSLDAIEGETAPGGDDDTAPATGTDGDDTVPATGTDATSLPPMVARLAQLVGTTLGWSLRLARGVTLPVRHLLHRG